MSFQTKHLNRLAANYSASKSQKDFNLLYNETYNYLYNFGNSKYANLTNYFDLAVSSTLSAMYTKFDIFDSTRSSFITWISTVFKNWLFYYKKTDKEKYHTSDFSFVTLEQDTELEDKIEEENKINFILEYLNRSDNPAATYMLAHMFEKATYISMESEMNLNTLKTRLRKLKKDIKIAYENKS